MLQPDESTILLVEDDTILLEMLQNYFSRQGYRVFATGWGEMALKIAAREIPDLVILDVHLPDIDGFEICARMRDSHITKYIPVIFLTQRNTRLDRLHGLGLGGIDYITKPFDLQDLRLRVKNVLRRLKEAQAGHVVTGLPVGKPVVDILDDVLQARDNGHSILLLTMRGLEPFREKYGFVAADIVLHFVSRTLSVAVSELDGENGFCGHIENDTFVLIINTSQLMLLQARITERLVNAFGHFYPAKGREEFNEDQRLDALIRTITPSSTAFENVDALVKTLLIIGHDLRAA